MRDFMTGLFDLNGDGEVDIFEKSGEMRIFADIAGEDESSSYDDEFELTGYDREELEFMDDAERREVLEDAGLDPDDYDF